MTERQLQFRVGVFVLMAMGVGSALILLFSDLKDFWQETYPLAIHFSEVPGLRNGSPVKQNGITIGSVKEIRLDDEQGGVLVIVEIEAERKLRRDARAHVARSLFGDSAVQFTAGQSDQFIPPRARLKGEAPLDPLEIVQRMEAGISTTLASFEATSREWQQVGKNLNDLLDTNRGNLNDVVEQAVVTLDGFNRTMAVATQTFAEAGQTLKTASSTLANANSLIADPQLQADLRRTAAALPQITEETQLTIAAARTSLQQVSQNLETIQQATLPIAEHSDVVARKLSGSLIQLESLLTELNAFSKVLNSPEGSLQKLAADPDLYRNLNGSASSLATLLDNLAPVLHDVRVFTDKIARHPELLGVSGAMRPSSGLKQSSEIQQTGYGTAPPSR